MADAGELAAGLAEFGLGQYEARAYVALLTGGTATAGELAYRAEIPRTKVYPVMTRLERKGLATVGGHKPVTCSAVPPGESLEGAIRAQIEKVNSMNALVSGLRAVSDGARRLRGAEERRYTHVGHAGVLARAQEMAASVSSSAHAMVDDAGLAVVAECGEALAAARRSGADVRVVAAPEAIGTAALASMPRGVGVRISRTGHNCAVLDGSAVLVLGGEAGRAAALEASAILGGDLERAFEAAWASAVPAAPLAALGAGAAREAYDAIVAIGEAGMGRAMAPEASRKPPGVAAILEERGIGLGGRSLGDVIGMADAAVRATCGGSVSLDEGGRGVTVESGLNSGRSLPWARVIEEYLGSRGVRTRTVYQARARRGERVHIKMSGGPAAPHKA